MKILHTADWHIGQTFYEYDRSYEHTQFLNWLCAEIKDKEIDVLIVSGDIFDLSNPSAPAQKLFYSFLSSALKAQPNLQIIITAGNHDSAARLESPKPLLESSNIHIVGMIERNLDGSINYEKLVIPIKDKQGNVQLWCMAIPFLRLGEYPTIAESISQYSAGVSALYKQAYEFTLSKKVAGQAILAMGHLHTLDAEISDHDKSERLIMGGVEFIPVSAFDDNIIYTALGHIHKAQKIGVKGNIHYSGSPLPMSFSEVNYKHQVITFEVNDEEISNIQHVEIPISIELMRVPSIPKPLSEVLDALKELPNSNVNIEYAPYLEVRVLLDGPEPALRHKIESELEGKHVRLAKIDVKYPKTSKTDEEEILTYDKLHELRPQDIFNKIYKSRFNIDTPAELVGMFNQVFQEANTKEN